MRCIALHFPLKVSLIYVLCQQSCIVCIFNLHNMHHISYFNCVYSSNLFLISNGLLLVLCCVHFSLIDGGLLHQGEILIVYFLIGLFFKLSIQNSKFKIIKQHKNDTCHVQSLENDYYLGNLGSFYYVFTQLGIASHFSYIMFFAMCFLLSLITSCCPCASHLITWFCCF
jgi:hypothetical protein